MIIQNGTIEIKNKICGGIDFETGYPIKNIHESWETPIPCQYSANKHNYLGRVSGEHFTTASYSILIESPRNPFMAEQIRLKDCLGNVIGEYSILSVEPLDAVCELRIIV